MLRCHNHASKASIGGDQTPTELNRHIARNSPLHGRPDEQGCIRIVLVENEMWAIAKKDWLRQPMWPRLQYLPVGPNDRDLCCGVRGDGGAVNEGSKIEGCGRSIVFVSDDPGQRIGIRQHFSEVNGVRLRNDLSGTPRSGIRVSPFIERGGKDRNTEHNAKQSPDAQNSASSQSLSPFKNVRHITLRQFPAATITERQRRRPQCATLAKMVNCWRQ